MFVSIKRQSRGGLALVLHRRSNKQDYIRCYVKTYIDKTSTFNDSDRVLLVNKSEGEMSVTIKLNKKLS